MSIYLNLLRKISGFVFGNQKASSYTLEILTFHFNIINTIAWSEACLQLIPFDVSIEGFFTFYFHCLLNLLYSLPHMLADCIYKIYSSGIVSDSLF